MDLKIKNIGLAPRGQAVCRPKTEKQDCEGDGRVTRCSRPDEVPALNLRKLFDSDEEDVSYNPLTERPVCVAPPDSSSTLSWGTALSARSFRSTSWIDEKVVPDDLPPPSEKYRKQYEQYKAELKENWRQLSQRTSGGKHASYQAAPEPVLRPAVCADEWMAEDEKALLQQCYTSKPYTVQYSSRKLEAEDVATEKRKQAVMEQVMVDQLSRAVISDPDQSSSSLEQSSNGDLGSAPLRFKKRTLHETKVKTSSSLTENLLSNKLRFDGRILSRNGRDATRELIGFFFTYDNTLTIYEYRQFGKNRMNALPFIAKGCYKHQCGRRMGAAYSLHDFCMGENLSFSTSELNMPESMKQRPLLLIRITDVDELTKSLLLNSVGDIKQGLSKEELDDKNTLKVIQGAVRERLKTRAVRMVTNLGRLLQSTDASGDGLLGRAEVWQALDQHHLGLSDTEFDEVWRILDRDGNGRVCFHEFVRAVVGEMNEFRKSFVRKAYLKLDPSKSGSTPMTDIEKFYCAKGHPNVVLGEAMEQELRGSFMESLQHISADPKMLSYSTFEDYYEGLSIGILHDQDFVNVLKNSWGI